MDKLFIILGIFMFLCDCLTSKRKRLQNKQIDFKVNGKSIKPNWQHGHYHLGYYHKLLEVPTTALYINEHVVEDYYRLSLVPDKENDAVIVAEKQAARQYLLDRIHYLQHLN